jgi:hypothetical protein
MSRLFGYLLVRIANGILVLAIFLLPQFHYIHFVNLHRDQLEGTQRLHTSARYSEVKRNLGIS